MGVNFMIRGVPASSGVAIGSAFVLPAWDWEFGEDDINAQDLAAEFDRLYTGIHSSKIEIRSIKDELSSVMGKEESSIFDAHLAILDDPAFMSEIDGIIRRQYKVAEVAVKETIDKFAGMFDLLDDEYMKERAVDIKDVGNRLIKHLLGAPEIKLPQDSQPFILVAKELSPSQLANLNPTHVLGIVTLAGGQTSHSAIMARALGIPMVVGVEPHLPRPIETGERLAFDGSSGQLVIEPDDDQIAEFEQKQQQWESNQRCLEKLSDVMAHTHSGTKFELMANINSPKEIRRALANGAQGVGLFRTEFVYMDRTYAPSEQEQFEVYRDAARALEGRPLTIRTLDTGGDKKIDYFQYPEEENPYLGYRAIRISLKEVKMFKQQLRAILRASAYGQIRIMYPMISSVDEVRRANEILEEAKQELSEAGIAYATDIPVGIMVEVPAAVAIADFLAQEVDFFSIGTNDLIQYVLAADRMNEHIADHYDPYHPAILHMLKTVADAGKRHGIEVSVCGEMAGDEQAVVLWLGLGIRKLSTNTSVMLQVKRGIRQIEDEVYLARFNQMMQCRTAAEIHQILKEHRAGVRCAQN